MADARIGVIGGSGIYEMEGVGVTHVKEIRIETPFGDPSDVFITGRLKGTKVVFLPRHGRNHCLLPSELNFRANIYGFKTLGVSHLLSITAVGSLQEHISPLDIVIPDQLVDRTYQRESSFFGDGIAAHIPFAEPFCPDLSNLLFTAASSLTAGVHQAKVHQGGTLVTIEGPAFSTRAESKLYRKWGIDVIGMTTLQEAKLAREAEICYAAIAMVTDYDCWRDASETVTVQAVVSTLLKNASLAESVLAQVIPQINDNRGCICADSLEGAIMTKIKSIPRKTRQRLWPLIKKYVSG